MKDWVKTKKPDYMNVAFTSERSIEDELNRQSQSDILTILISYIIMFAYITISLGQMRSCGRLLVRKHDHLYVKLRQANLRFVIHIHKKCSNIRHKCSKLITTKMSKNLVNWESCSKWALCSIIKFEHHAEVEHYAWLEHILELIIMPKLNIMLKLNIMPDLSICSNKE